jgi:hypothetical protein
MELGGALDELLGGLCEFGCVCAPANALTANAASAMGNRYFFMPNLLMNEVTHVIMLAF